jgi:hypothetical protein
VQQLIQRSGQNSRLNTEGRHFVELVEKVFHLLCAEHSRSGLVDFVHCSLLPARTCSAANSIRHSPSARQPPPQNRRDGNIPGSQAVLLKV